MAKKGITVDIEILDSAVERAIAKYVNGKIDRLQKCMDAHNKQHEADMAEIKPYLTGARNFTGFFKTVKWVGYAAGSLGGSWLLLKQVFPNFILKIW